MKKLSKSHSSKIYLEKKFCKKSKPISKETEIKLEQAASNASKKISLNHTIYSQSNSHTNETIISDSESVMNHFMEKLSHNEFAKDTEPSLIQEEELSEQFINQQMESYHQLLNSPIVQEIFQEERSLKKKITHQNN